MDRDAISSSVAANTDYTEEEADQVVDNLVTGLESSYDQAQDTADAFSTGSILIFIGLIIGLGVSVYGGDFGHKQALSWYERYIEEVEDDLEND